MKHQKSDSLSYY
ncbi:putative vesicle protein sorting-associated, partial [Danaus plexippus plexippus]